MRPIRWILLSMLCAHSAVLFATAPAVPLVQNQGQWHSKVLYRGMMHNSAVFVEANAMTYLLWSGLGHEHHGTSHDHVTPHGPAMHAYRVTFEGAKGNGHRGLDRLPYYENHFIGDDPNRWAGHVPVFSGATMTDLYPGIDLRVSGQQALKYDLIVAPGSDPSVIELQYEGADELRLVDGEIHIHTSAGMVVENKPYAYQVINDRQVEVACRYSLHGDRVHFELPERYREDLQLVIDPVLSFSTYSGSNADNFGFTASYDDAGHLYGGGIAFGANYPTTTGALDVSFNGADIDIALTKFSPDGTSLIWSTYLGGTQNETPHSLVVNSNEELYVMGASGSADFPTPGGAYDGTFNGGTPIILTPGPPPQNDWAGTTGGYGFGHAVGTDIVVAHLAGDGASLIGSTFIGGSQNDGVNNTQPLAYNYGDAFRGEIALDAQERPVVATSTHSNNMPTSNAPQGGFGGGLQDGYLFRMNPGLTSLLWGTYVGGSGEDSGFGLQFSSNGEIYVTGGTTSGNLPMAGSPFNGSQSGGVDAYIMRYTPSGNSLISSTFFGTGAYDQSYFVQLNTADEVFIVGQSLGNLPVTSGKYTNPGSGQFICKFDQSLSTNLWTTVVGRGSGVVDISPTAFLVSDCGQIYLSGWGGSTNTNNGQPTNSTTTGLPITSDAFQSSTDGSDFYLMLLDPEASALAYATYFGGNQSNEHVDGGTSRFSKDGTVYQAVCAGCGGNSDFPSTPGAWSPTNQSSNCNLGVFKFNISQNQAQIGINGPDQICLGETAQFQNTSIGGNGYSWNFGDTNTSIDFEPGHTYTQAGIYTVTMVLEDTSFCTHNDTTTITVEVFDPADAQVAPHDTICEGMTIQLQASGGVNYTWSPAATLSDPNIADPIASPMVTTTYTVLVEDPCGIDTLEVTVVVGTPTGGAGPDQTMCVGGSAQLQGNGGVSYLWSPASTLDDATLPMPTATPSDTTTYTVQIVNAAGCMYSDSMQVIVQFQQPATISNDTAVCPGGMVQLQAWGGDFYNWQAAPGITTLNVPDPLVTPPQSTTYVVNIGNACGVTPDDVFVEVIETAPVAWPDTTVCPGEPATLHAAGGIDYVWSPAGSTLPSDSSVTQATPSAPTTYKVTVTDQWGCVDSAFAFVDLHPQPAVDAGADEITNFWTPVQLYAAGDTGAIHWTPEELLSCVDCWNPIASTETTQTFTITVTDSNTCKAIDHVQVIIEGSLFVPNAFTPNGDGINDAFYAYAVEWKEFELLVFNRWGELIYETDDPTLPWDGTYKGVESPIDTYVWKVKMTELAGRRRQEIGHVSLIR